MTADGAEPPRSDPAEVERAETTHRDPADRDTPRVSAAPPERLRDDLTEDVGGPWLAGMVVPPAVVAFRQDHDRRAVAEPAQRRCERWVDHVDRVCAVPMQEDEQRSPLVAARRRDQHFVQPLAHELA